MKHVIAKNTKTEELEHFYFSDHISVEHIEECLKYIKHGYTGNWVRIPREIVSIEEVKSFSVYKMKYIKSLNTQTNIENIVVFSIDINHDFMYQAFQASSEDFYSVISAGFTDGETCGGKSETLNKVSNSEDIKLFI